MSVEAKGARKRVTAGVKGDPGLFVHYSNSFTYCR